MRRLINRTLVDMDLLLTTLLNLLALQGVKYSVQEQPESAQNGNVSCSVYFLLGHNNGTFSRTSIENFKFEARKPIKFIIHDWCDNIESPWILEMQKVMSGTNRWHVIAIDWAEMSGGGFSNASLSSGGVADKLTDFTIGLLRTNALRTKFVHYIGHGLGAVIGIQAAYKISARVNKRISRLTALDPTLRHIAYRNIADDLKQLADFVDAIHTNSHQMGTEEPIGHVDFYVNGGKSQPDCGTELTTNAIKKENSTGQTSAICSHVRACEYWISSIINPHAFCAFNYQLWQEYVSGQNAQMNSNLMGIAANPTMPWGSYYVPATSGPPHVIANFHPVNKSKLA